jgi:hypothetical protein
MTQRRQPILRGCRPSDLDALVSLWSRCGLLRPWNDPNREISTPLATASTLSFVGGASAIIACREDITA